ncbi:hypothetical protein JL720_308 [Aureococcus anophagefferens]|nr:hypothetical protein JL720_308 [Aureococcus anophagefferens]
MIDKDGNGSLDRAEICAGVADDGVRRARERKDAECKDGDGASAFDGATWSSAGIFKGGMGMNVSIATVECDTSCSA